MTTARLIDASLQRLASGDLSAIRTLRGVLRSDLDEVAAALGPYLLTMGALRRVVAEMPLDHLSQQHARVWAHFWIEGRLPQQDEGASPAFSTEWDERFHNVIAEILFRLWELGEELEGGWLTEGERARLLRTIDAAVT